jgi:L-amino acid N-acyltransferase YncA
LRHHQEKIHEDRGRIECSACKRFATRFINWLEALYSELTTH